MVACDREASARGAVPLRFGEILSAAEMMPDFGSLPLERWPVNRCPPPSGEGPCMETIPEFRRTAASRLHCRDSHSWQEFEIVAAFERLNSESEIRHTIIVASDPLSALGSNVSSAEYSDHQPTFKIIFPRTWPASLNSCA